MFSSFRKPSEWALLHSYLHERCNGGHLVNLAPLSAFGQSGLSCADHVLSLRASHKFYPQSPAKESVNYLCVGRTGTHTLMTVMTFRNGSFSLSSIKIVFVGFKLMLALPPPQHYVTIKILKCNK